MAKAAVGRQEEQKRWPQGVDRACLGWWRVEVLLSEKMLLVVF